jgi:hypothetical protein
VICLDLSNLYEMTDSDPQQVDGQILAALAARIRRAAGFRCLVGLYHLRCFVVVMGSERAEDPIAGSVASLRALAELPLSVTAEWQLLRSFVPQIGVGVVTIDLCKADPLRMLNQAEHMASLSAQPRASSTNTAASTTPAELC